MNSICMFTPSADGGHALYAQELMTALCAPPRPPRQMKFELVSSENLHPEFRCGQYDIHPILPALLDRRQIGSRLGWVANRVMHYPRREMTFLKWLRGRPDIGAVHFQEWTPWLAAPLFRRIRKMGKKIFYTVHNVVPHKYPKYVPKAVMDGWIRRACLMCDGLYVLSDLLAEELDRFLGQPHPPIHVAPHGVWTVHHAVAVPSMEERLAWKKLLFFGSIRRNKGLHLLLQAAEALPGYSITIAGEPTDGDYFRNEIVPQIRQLRERGMKIDLRDHFIPDAELAELFASHSAIVLPYTSEFVAQSGVVFMALAYEIPVVASEAGGLKDLLKKFKIGVNCSAATADGLAAGVNALFALDMRSQLEREIQAARRHYSWQKAAAATIDGYLAATPAVEENACTLETTAA